MIGQNRRRWADACEAVLACNSDDIVAVDSKSSVLRVCQRDDVQEPDAEAAEPEGVTDRQRELAQLAQIVADAYSTAHDHARDSSSRGYELLARFAELSFQRLAAIERAYGQLLAAHARAIDNASNASDGLDGAIGEIVGRAIAGKGNGKPTESGQEQAP